MIECMKTAAKVQQEENPMEQMTTELMECICDKYCKYPCTLEQEQLDEKCDSCEAGQIVIHILNEYNRIAPPFKSGTVVYCVGESCEDGYTIEEDYYVDCYFDQEGVKWHILDYKHADTVHIQDKYVWLFKTKEEAEKKCNELMKQNK